MRFGDYMRGCRNEKGMTLDDASSKLDVHLTYLSKIENERTPPPSEDLIRRMCELYGVEDADYAVALAGKVPGWVREALVEDPSMVRALRRVVDEHTEEEPQ